MNLHTVSVPWKARPIKKVSVTFVWKNITNVIFIKDIDGGT
jgi:hypothetical protein